MLAKCESVWFEENLLRRRDDILDYWNYFDREVGGAAAGVGGKSD
jgi:hypothetical protein